jgi:hypothetical protein
MYEVKDGFFNSLKMELERMTKHVMGEEIRIFRQNLFHLKRPHREPDRADYPILKGKEAMIEATFRGCPDIAIVGK